MDDRKRKLCTSASGEHEDSDRNMMILLKRLHLDKTSELYEKVPLFEKRAVGSKRWRLSPIKEYEQSRGVKRRRVDSEMADQMNTSLWISNKEQARTSSSLPPNTTVSDNATSMPDHTDVINQQINLNIDLGARQLSLDEKFIRRQVREQNMQLVLWTPPLLDALLQDTRQQDSCCRVQQDTCCRVQQEEPMEDGTEWEMC